MENIVVDFITIVVDF